MATTTSTETADASARDRLKNRAESFVRGAGVAGIVGIVWLHTALLGLIANEVLGEQLGDPAGLVFSIVLGVPVVASTAVFVVYLGSLVVDTDIDWAEVVIQAVAGAWLLTPVLWWVRA